MAILIGLFIAFGSMFLGYLGCGGELRLLFQPWEFIIIIGSAVGAAIFTAPWQVVVGSFGSLKYLFKTEIPVKKDYLEVLLFFFNIFRVVKSKGTVEIDKHINSPFESHIFQSAPFLLNDKKGLDFLCDCLRMVTFGMTNSEILDTVMKKQIKSHDEEQGAYANFFLQLGDSLPALGIVAAVLGVIVSMKSIGEPPQVLGKKIAAALVGTFCGILLSYVLVSPIGHFIMSRMQHRLDFLNCLRIGMLSYLNGHSPAVIVEVMRQAIPDKFRPDFQETEKFLQDNLIKIT
jgi:chemotaxis protein MotA